MQRRRFMKACGGVAAGLMVPAYGWGDDGGSCHGTSFEFVESPSEAARLAKKQQKLVFVLHVSGEFEDSGLT